MIIAVTGFKGDNWFMGFAVYVCCLGVCGGGDMVYGVLSVWYAAC